MGDTFEAPDFYDIIPNPSSGPSHIDENRGDRVHRCANSFLQHVDVACVLALIGQNNARHIPYVSTRWFNR